METKSWLKNIGVVMVKKGCGYSGLGTNLAVSQGGVNWINWFLAKKGCGLSGHGTLKSAVSQEWIDEMCWFFACWYKFRKAKSYFNNYWVGMVKNVKLDVSHK